MSIATEIRENQKKAFYAWVGAGDLWVEQVRSLPSETRTRLAKAREQRKELQQRFRIPTSFGAVVNEYKQLPTQVKTAAGEINGKATEVYGDLVTRGERLVAKVRNQASTKEAGRQVKATVARAKATRTSAKKAADATTDAVKDAANTVG